MTSPVPSNDEVSLAEIAEKMREFSRRVWEQRMLVARFALGAIAVGLFVALGSGEEYTAQTRVLPYRGAGGASGGLAGLAGLAGIRLPAGGAELTIPADLYPEVARSLDFRVSVAETPLVFRSLGKQASTVEYFRDVYEMPPSQLVRKFTIGLPATLSAFLSDGSAASPSSNDVSDSTSIITYDREYLRLVNSLEERLSVSIDKKTGIITIAGKMPDAYAAADLVRISSARLTESVIAYESRKAGEQFRFVREQHELARSRYEVAQDAVATFADRNRSLTSATSQVERDRLQRDYELAFEVFQQLSRELEQARVRMNQDTPVFTTLERVAVPTLRTSPKRAKILLVSLFVGVAVGVGVVGARRKASTS